MWSGRGRSGQRPRGKWSLVVLETGTRQDEAPAVFAALEAPRLIPIVAPRGIFTCSRTQSKSAGGCDMRDPRCLGCTKILKFARNLDESELSQCEERIIHS